MSDENETRMTEPVRGLTIGRPPTAGEAWRRPCYIPVDEPGGFRIYRIGKDGFYRAWGWVPEPEAANAVCAFLCETLPVNA